MTRTAIAIATALSSLFTGCAFDGAGASGAELVEGPALDAAPLVYERLEAGDAMLEITAVPDAADHARWAGVELVYFDGVEERELIVDLVTDPVPHPQALVAFMREVDPEIREQLTAFRGYEEDLGRVAPSPNAELLWTLHDNAELDASVDTDAVRLPLDPECLGLHGAFYECIER